MALVLSWSSPEKQRSVMLRIPYSCCLTLCLVWEHKYELSQVQLPSRNLNLICLSERPIYNSLYLSEHLIYNVFNTSFLNLKVENFAYIFKEYIPTQNITCFWNLINIILLYLSSFSKYIFLYNKLLIDSKIDR